MLQDKIRKWKNIMSWVLFVCSGVIIRDKNTLMYNYSRDKDALLCSVIAKDITKVL